MVAKINVGSSLYGALSYNGEKVNEGEGKLLVAHKVFDQGDGKLDIARCMEDFKRYIPEQVRSQKPVAHISLNPHPDDKLNDAELMNIAQEYMDKIGYGNQPYVVFKHSDISREHLHIVTLNVDEKGKKLSDRYIHRCSKRATDALEKQYNLHPSGSRRQRLEQGALYKVNASEGNVKRQIGNVLKHLSGNYRFQTLGEYRALLSLYNITVEEARGEVNGREYLGFVYSATNDKGEKVGNPLKASRFGKHAGCDAFDKRCVISKNEIEGKEIGKYTKGKVFAAMRQSSSKEELIKNLKDKGVDVVFRKTDIGRIYGATFIDHNTGCVLNGSKMGKELSANALEEWVSRKEAQQARFCNAASEPSTQASQQYESTEQCPEGDNIIGGMLDLSLLPDRVDPEEEAFRRQMQRKKKKLHRRI